MKKGWDYKFLPRELQDTPIGKRYESTCAKMLIRALEIKMLFGRLRLKEITRDIAEPQIHFCRREYLKYSNLAHAALDELTKTYNWPAESVADESFSWPAAPDPHEVCPTFATPPMPSETPQAFVVAEAGSLQARLKPLVRQGFRITKITLPPKSSADESPRF